MIGNKLEIHRRRANAVATGLSAGARAAEGVDRGDAEAGVDGRLTGERR